MPLTRPAPSQYRIMPTRLQEPLPDGRTRCNLCLWRCGLRHGQRGFCQAHVNRHGTLYNLSYGIISSMAVTPIEEKPVKHYRPGTRVLNVGSYGCSFRCGGCHNLEISWAPEALDALARGESTAAYVTPEELVQAAQRQGVQGIAFTYSEPAVWLEYVLDVSVLAHEAGLYTVYVTNSFVTDEALELMAPHVDVMCSDIKSLSDEFYQRVCQAARVEEVLHCIEKAQRLGIHVETRTNVIPRSCAPSRAGSASTWGRRAPGTSRASSPPITCRTSRRRRPRRCGPPTTPPARRGSRTSTSTTTRVATARSRTCPWRRFWRRTRRPCTR